MSSALQQTKSNSSPAFTANGILQRQCACGSRTIAGGDCDSCQKKKVSGNLQRTATNAEAVNEAPPIVHDVLRSPGQPLDASTRGFFEPRFGHNFSRISACSSNRHVARRKLIVGQRRDQYEVEADAIAARVAFAPTPMNGPGYDFSDVRIHTDARAAESARAVNARAYTVGRNIVFGAGQFAPQTARGRQVLAHELTHVVQQQAGEARGGEKRLQRFGFEDVLEITVALTRMGKKSLTYQFEFFLKGERIAHGQVSSVCCRVYPGEHRIESIEIPAGIRSRLEVTSSEADPAR